MKVLTVHGDAENCSSEAPEKHSWPVNECILAREHDVPPSGSVVNSMQRRRVSRFFDDSDPNAGTVSLKATSTNTGVLVETFHSKDCSGKIASSSEWQTGCKFV